MLPCVEAAGKASPWAVPEARIYKHSPAQAFTFGPCGTCEFAGNGLARRAEPNSPDQGCCRSIARPDGNRDVSRTLRFLLDSTQQEKDDTVKEQTEKTKEGLKKQGMDPKTANKVLKAWREAVGKDIEPGDLRKVRAWSRKWQGFML